MQNTMILLFVTLLTIINVHCVAALSGYATNDGEGNLYGNACGMDGTADAFGNWAWTATGGDRFDDGYGCGKCYTVSCTGAHGNNPSCSCDTSKTLTIQAINECPECVGDHIFDLTADAMTYFTGSSSMTGICGELDVEYERVDCSSISDNFRIRNKEGTSQDWYGFHLDDVNDDGGIRYVELLKDGSSIATCDKSNGASYWLCNGGSRLSASTPLDIKITSDLGKSVTAYNCITSFWPNAEMRCNTNLNGGDSDSGSDSGSDNGSDNGSDDTIEILVNSGSNEWWMAIEFPNNDNSAITNLEFRDSNHGSWISGSYESWGTGAYSFNDGIQFSGYQHFRVTTSSGNTAISWNVFSGLSVGSTAYIDLPSGSSFTYTQEKEDDTSFSITMVIIVSVVLLSSVCIVIGIIIYCFIKRRNKQKLAVSFEDDNNNNNNDNKVKEDGGEIDTTTV